MTCLRHTEKQGERTQMPVSHPHPPSSLYQELEFVPGSVSNERTEKPPQPAETP